MFLIGIFTFLCIIGWGILTGTEIRNFIDPASFIFVVLSNVAILITTKGFQEFIYGLKVLVLKNIDIESQKLTDSIMIFSLLKRSSIGIGILGFLMGIVMMLSRITDISNIGPAAAVTILSVFYSTLLAVAFFSPAHYSLCKIEKNIEQRAEQKSSQNKNKKIKS